MAEILRRRRLCRGSGSESSRARSAGACGAGRRANVLNISMGEDEDHFWDDLSPAEQRFVETITHELADVSWAGPLLRDIAANGGLIRANKARFFELRFGYALHQAGIVPAYEVTGEADSTLDFGFASRGQDWLVELMRLEETDAVRRATHTGTDENGVRLSRRMLSTDAEDARESPEGETIKAVERICQKLEHGGRPHKFPVPARAYHAILIDFRTFLHGGDVVDRIHVGVGGEYVPVPCRHYWNGELISGVFSPRTTLRGAAQARERVHFLGFVCEERYRPGTFAAATQFVGNPNLFQSAEEAQAVIATWPLQPATVL